jgi:hypothetical protein
LSSKATHNSFSVLNLTGGFLFAYIFLFLCKKTHVPLLRLYFIDCSVSKTENKPFIGLAPIDISDGISWKFKIVKIAATLKVEALTIGETLEIIEKMDSEQNFVIFTDSENMLKGIGNTSTMKNTSHITKILKIK